MNESDAWIVKYQETQDFYEKDEYEDMRAAWIEATRRADSKIKELEEKLQAAEHAIKDILIVLYDADRKARLECAELCEEESMFKPSCPYCAEAIRATIKEE